MANVREFEDGLQKEFEEKTKGKLVFIITFSEREFKKQMMEKGLNPKETVSLGGGAFCKKSDLKDILKVRDDIEAKRKEFYSKNVYDYVNYMLWDYEVFYQGNYKEFLKETLDFDDDFIQKNRDEINKAISDYHKGMLELEM